MIDEAVISREWIRALQSGVTESVNAPKHWSRWRNGLETAKPLVAEKIKKNRSKEDQLPQDPEGAAKLQLIYDHFKGDSYAFEPCAAKLAQLLDKNITKAEVTRRSRDGGRDAIGLYKIGLPENSIAVDFALEAKCYARDNPAGVKETSG